MLALLEGPNRGKVVAGMDVVRRAVVRGLRRTDQLLQGTRMPGCVFHYKINKMQSAPIEIISCGGYLQGYRLRGAALVLQLPVTASARILQLHGLGQVVYVIAGRVRSIRRVAKWKMSLHEIKGHQMTSHPGPIESSGIQAKGGLIQAGRLVVVWIGIGLGFWPHVDGPLGRADR